MELELFNDVVAEEDDELEAYADNENFMVDGERCGICMDIIIDRGVLDCCQHWFCFVCIDNWATITNLCPLCQNEFQMITCVPVYDTVGGNKTDEDSVSRDDDWCIEGKNNTLSFPSYYIDENAVTCLDGDGCKIRSGSVTLDENSTVDTSIACDSCDQWYHAFCVEFDPEGTYEDSWLCPRCRDGTQQKGDDKLVHTGSTQSVSDSSNHRCLVDTYSGKVSVSVADAGETAVVVSMIDGARLNKESTESYPSTAEVNWDRKIESSTLGPDMSSSETTKPKDEKIRNILPRREAKDVGKSLRSHALLSLHHNFDKSTSNVEDGKTRSLRDLDMSKIPQAKCNDSFVKSEANGSGTDTCLNQKSYGGSSIADGKVQRSRYESLCCPSDKNLSPNENMPDAKADHSGIVSLKRKAREHRKSDSIQGINEDTNSEVRLEPGRSKKKVKTDDNIQMSPLRDKSISDLDDFQKTNKEISGSKDQKPGHEPECKTLSCDIMSIVQDPESRSANRLVRQNQAKGKRNAAGLRMKKIMRRTAVDKNSSELVQKLRKEIREAVRDKSSEEIGKSIFEPKLLAAFRVAVASPVAEPVHKAAPMLKVKRLMLQKGKTRENLTRKIYATSSGKRRRAWDRDCEVEFWKHRSTSITKPEKIETLKSVLSLLRKNSESENPEQNSEEAKGSILSRLYLADASVFPREENIKPLSVLKAASDSGQNSEISSAEKDIKTCVGIQAAKPLDGSNVPSQSSSASIDNKKNKSSSSSLKNGFHSSNVQPDGNPEQPSSKLDSQKMMGKSDDVKTDKKKWALEVLARKAASYKTSTKHKNEEDNAVFKGNYPLLAQLPADMRPKLAPIRHNKIPISVRQTQLYRLAEHFLKMANLSSIHRTAATELAVADAVNIEKEVAERSNSKLVYLNLCSQKLRHQTTFSNSCTAPESNPSSPLLVIPEHGEPSVSTPFLDPEAEAVLRAVGLLPDSPSASPHHDATNLDPGGDFSLENGEEEIPEDVLEMGSNPELDIYGDFEYNLEDVDFINASAVKTANTQTEEETKMKVVFSSLSSDKSVNAMDNRNNDCSKVEAVSNAASSGDFSNEGKNGSSELDDKANSLCLPADPSIVDGGEEPSVAECEELYGPDKEPLIQKFPELVSSEDTISHDMDNLKGETDAKDKLDDDQNHKSVEEDPVTDSQAGEKVQDKNCDTKVAKSSNNGDGILKKVEAYIKEHIRPLCKSSIITVEQYRWAVGKTKDKVMKYHSKAKNADFLIKEGEKVKKLAEQYVEAAKRKADK